MEEIIGVRFNSAGKAYYFDPCGMKLSVGTMVIVETARGVEMGKVSIPNRQVSSDELKSPLKKIIRVATDEDKKQLEENTVKEKEAFKTANELIKEHKLDMKLIDVEYTFDRSKILFYFTADGRVDFRELVKSLASVFRTRIELRQIGVRDEARQLGSIGICGRFLCCSTFLDDFRPVSIKMAKEQGLYLNPTKISGVCGRLMCCLQYEQNAYEDALKSMPPRGAAVETIDGTGVVVDTNTLKQQIRVKPDGVEGHKTDVYKVGEFNVIGQPPTVSLEELKQKKEQEALDRFTLTPKIQPQEDIPHEEPEAEEAEPSKQPRRKKQPSRRPKRSQNKKNGDSAPKDNGSSKQGTAPKKPRRPRRPSQKKPSNGGYTNQ